MNNHLPQTVDQPSPKPKGSLRLSKYLAQSGVAARRKAEELIASGKVKVNGKTVTTTPFFIDPSTDTVDVAGEVVTPTRVPVLYALYKPRGVLSTLAMEEGPGLAPYLPQVDERLFPVGRLDQESEGLLLLTNDGQLALELTHPRYEHPKTYRVWLSGSSMRTTSQTIEALKQSRRIAGRMRKFDQVEFIARDKEMLIVEVTIHEGLRHLIRRYADAAGYTVHRLIRIKHGPYELGDLQPGHCRELTRKA